MTGALTAGLMSPDIRKVVDPWPRVVCVVGTISSARASDSRANLGRIAMSHISGRAGWWKFPSPVLVRASGEQSPGATRHSKLTVNDPNPEASHRPILYDSGRPSSVIWFRTLHATTGLGHSPASGPGAKPIPENRCVPKARILHPRLEMVAGLLLPAAPARASSRP